MAKRKLILVNCIVLLCCVISLFSCKYSFVDDNKFVGQWELKGKNSFAGLQLNIQKEKEEYVGRIITLPKNDLFKTFLTINDPWITKIERTSNFEFKITEKRIASALFSEYGLPTTTVYKAVFISDTKIGLAENNGSPKTSTLYLQRIIVQH